MRIRRATCNDIPSIGRLLDQVLAVHHQGRPDLFRPNARKYTDDELVAIIRDEQRPIFVAVERQGDTEAVLGYAFCVLSQHIDDNILTDIRTLYIDDLCVDGNARGKHVGTTLYEHVVNYAREARCYNVTLNVWTCNEGAMRFYERLGLKPQKIGMETILEG